MLIAACRAEGINIRLIETQVKYVKDIFISDIEDSAALLVEGIIAAQLHKDIDIEYSKNRFKGYGAEEIQRDMTRLYNLIFKKKSYQNYFNSMLLNECLQIFKNLMALYEYFLVNEGIEPPFLKRMERSILNLKPSAVGFSIYSLEPFTRLLRKKIKNLGIPIIMGGAFTSQLEKQDIKELFKNDYLDYLILYSGEKALPQLLNALDIPGKLKQIPNLLYIDKKKIIFNEIKVIEDINLLPNPDFSQFNLDAFPIPEVVLPLQTARGCTWKNCTFCAHHKSYLGHYTAYSEEKLLEILTEYREKYRSQHIAFHDEEIPVERFKALSKLFIDNGVEDFRFYAYARLVSGFDQEVLASMVQAGFMAISWGLESGSDKVLKLMKKGTNTHVMKRVLKDASDKGLVNICWVIFGFPGESFEDVNYTLTFLYENRRYIDLLLMSRFQLEIGSPIHEKMMKQKVSYSSRYNADALIEELQLKEQLGSIQLTNKKYHFLAKSNLSRMAVFLMNAKVKKIEAEDIVLEKNYESYYPLILGIVDDEPLSFKFCNRSESLSSNILSKEIIVLDNCLKDLIAMADGSNPLSEIISFLRKHPSFYREKLDEFVKKLIEKKSIIFLEGIADMPR